MKRYVRKSEIISNKGKKFQKIYFIKIKKQLINLLYNNT